MILKPGTKSTFFTRLMLYVYRTKVSFFGVSFVFGYGDRTFVRGRCLAEHRSDEMIYAAAGVRQCVMHDIICHCFFPFSGGLQAYSVCHTFHSIRIPLCPLVYVVSLSLSLSLILCVFVCLPTLDLAFCQEHKIYELRIVF